MNEYWVQIQGYEDLYEVSNLGRVRGIVTSKGWKAGRLLNPGTNGNGYVVLFLFRDCKRERFYLHRLVARHFLGDPNGKHVNHIDSCRQNNAVSNLEYCTVKENAIHATRNNRLVRKTLTPETVALIRDLYPLGQFRYQDFARIFGVTHSAISHLLARRSWDWL